MANHIFPLYLDAPKQTNASGTVSWNGTSSLLETGSTTATIGDAKIPGTMLSVVTNGVAAVTINYTNGVSASQNTVAVVSSNAGTTVTSMWNGSAWVVLSDVDVIVDAQ